MRFTFNTAISFITNTNWQNYGGESTMSYLVQMFGLTTRSSLESISNPSRKYRRQVAPFRRLHPPQPPKLNLPHLNRSTYED